MNTLGERMRHIRKVHAYTQTRVAQALGMSNVQLSRYESGERKPEPEMIKAIASFYEVSTDYLLGTIDAYTHKDDTAIDKALNDPELGLWFKDIQDASPERQEELKQFWEFIKTKEKDRKSGDKQ
ncbi:helix-turn-helix domain-containing protein [Priestia taiwanensis]|uniref:HTH-type transcriptional regulator Xre n=1 Tax=Priestia taiwanensis TaxID=1347902 RepID=A0A917AKM7_9BACI|nr:helix-turn-helix transcriptional regulator [Priestia taiwanensis]MBM7361959.1 transcriptional regulator with XRE-family HTH domain [Priestia taiwanensis]GGE58363.1 HTH-type transcriptional regulator Xre [Priestia taiwanensis]